MDFSGFGGGGFDINAILGKLATLAPEWSPFPVLEQMNQQPYGAGVESPMSPETQQGFDWVQPTAPPPPPFDPSKVQGGPLAGVSAMPTPGAAVGKTAAPLTVQQMAALRAMNPQAQQEPTRFAPAVTPPGGRQIAPMQTLGFPAAATPPRMSLAQILGLGR